MKISGRKIGIAKWSAKQPAPAGTGQIIFKTRVSPMKTGPKSTPCKK
ncbi:MAG: hypothetical protein WBL19_03235 [Minisyncoccia bacterium]